MKKIIVVLLAIFLIISCSDNKKDILIGTWYTESIEKDWYSEDSINCISFIEYTDTNNYQLYKSSNGDWYFFRDDSMNSINQELIHFISDDKFEILLSDSVKNPVYNRIEKNIKPNQMIFDLFNNFFQYAQFWSNLRIDTLGDETIFYNIVLTGTKEKSILTIEHQIKYFFDKQMKSLPKEEKSNIYIWEDLNTKILMECYFRFNKYDTIDDTMDELEVKIWQNVK